MFLAHSKKSMANDHSHVPRALFAAIAVLIAGSTLLTYAFGVRVIRMREAASGQRHLIAEIQTVLSTMVDAETGQRGFVITGDESYLQVYEDALRRLPQDFGSLASGDGSEISLPEISALRRLANAKLTELRSVIEARRTSGFEAAAELIKTGAGKQKMNELREVFGRLIARHQELLEEETKIADRATRTRTAVFISCGLASLLFVGWSYRRIGSVLAEREAARHDAEEQRAQAQRQKEYLAVTLASIGDCVIVADPEGRITFMNSIAEKTTGWSMAEAQTMPAAEVFHIINEETRQPVEGPVAKVLKLGVVIGLANHTLLVRKDGTELPIDDSGAPIRDEQGHLHGVVLVFRDFSEHRKNAAEMRAAREAAEAASSAKDKFLAMLSHELRTPLAPVLTMLNLWENSDDVPAALKPDVQMLRRNVELEARIIDDLLDMTRIARGMIAITTETTNVHDLIRYLVTMLRSNINDKRLAVSLQLEAPRPHVHTDASRLQQILWNILNNAIKFSDAAGSLTVATANDSLGNLRIEVVDTGIGMAPGTLDRLFDPFEQADRSYRNPGLGLGLAISRGLVDLLGGKLVADSKGLGQGSTFTITFPATDPPLSHGVDGNGVASTAPPPPLHILLVEDHDDTARALVRLLATRGHQVEVASNVATAADAVKGHTFDLVICDIGLPDGTGFDIVQKIRRTSATPVLALSGFGNTEDVAKAKEAGFDAHLTKPVNFRRLEATIWQLTSRR